MPSYRITIENAERNARKDFQEGLVCKPERHRYRRGGMGYFSYLQEYGKLEKENCQDNIDKESV